MALNEDDLLRLLHSTEHSYAERKTANDSRDWVKTIVAFANSLDPSQEGVLFIGATDTGEIEAKQSNLDKLQKTLSEKLQSIYPPVYSTTKILKEGDQECIAVIVPGSSAKPHFAGPVYVRAFSKTVIAPAEQYETLLAARTSKVREIQKCVDREITFVEITRSAGMAYVVNRSSRIARVIACSQFFVTLEVGGVGGSKTSYPLNSFDINFDHVSNRLQIERTVPETIY